MSMNHRERVLAAIDHEPLDRFPTDIWAVDEIRQRLIEYCGVSDWRGVLDALDIDGIIELAPQYTGPALPDLGEVLVQNEWGMVDRLQRYETGVYWEQVGYPLSDAETVADIDAFDWPDPAAYEFDALPDRCAAQGERAIGIGYTAVFYYHNKLRGLEKSMMDLAMRPEFSRHLIRRISDWFVEYHTLCFEAASSSIDLTQVTDDYGSQSGLLISKRMFADFYQPWLQRSIDLAKSYGLKVFHHDDGAIMPLIPILLEMGIDLLNPIQWRCKGMDREVIAREFGGRVCFHGGVDNQETLPFGTVDDVRHEVAYNLTHLGATGSGYILAPCHNIQANTSIDNILAMYEAPRTID